MSMDQSKQTSKKLKIAVIIVTFLIAVIACLFLIDINRKAPSPIEVPSEETTSSQIQEIKPKEVVETKKPETKQPEIKQNANAKAKNNLPSPAVQNKEEIVVYNTKSGKYHKESCEWVKKCHHCIRIPKSSAIKRKGVPCKVCGHI